MGNSMRNIRKIVRDKMFLFLLPKIVLIINWLVGVSCKKHWYGLDYLQKLKQENQPWIYSIWHNNVLMSPWLLRNNNTGIMVSNSKEGEVIAKVVLALKNQPFRGSTSRGGLKALHGLIKYIKLGHNGAITPDGPRGPKYVLQGGAITLAQKSGAPLIPFHYEAVRQWVFSSWDKHKLPKPFSDLVIRFGEPFYVPKKMDSAEFERVRVAFQEKMLENVSIVEKIVEEIKTESNYSGG